MRNQKEEGRVGGVGGREREGRAKRQVLTAQGAGVVVEKEVRKRDE